MAVRPAVFLDRDGVLARTDLVEGRPVAVRDVGRFALLDGAAEAVRRLKAAGFATVVVTNQPEIARGGVSAAEVAKMHEILSAAMPLDAIEVCPHDEPEGCDCRKPRPGMLFRAAARLDLDLAASYMVGDRWRDVGAGRTAGCRTIRIEAGYAEPEGPSADRIAADITEAVAIVLAETR